MLGKLVADSGAAQRITSKLISAFGVKNIQWAVVLAGFIVGVPMFYTVGFVILIPLVFTVAASTGLPLRWILNISMRDSLLGKGTSICRPNLPERNNAASNASGRLVAANTITISSPTPNPSISVSN